MSRNSTFSQKQKLSEKIRIKSIFTGEGYTKMKMGTWQNKLHESYLVSSVNKRFSSSNKIHDSHTHVSANNTGTRQAEFRIGFD